MQIISGAFVQEKIHFEALPSSLVSYEMTRFINWFNQTRPTKKSTCILGPVRAAIAHLYFKSIHPFEDGNGRIGRAISEKALAQDLNHSALLSLSSVIYKNRKKYYEEFSIASKNNLDITQWISYFVNLIWGAQLEAKDLIHFTLKKAKFWKIYDTILSERQKKVVTRIFKEGSEGFKGGITAKNYMIITHCSKATATRDLTDLVNKKCLTPCTSKGRSTAYDINLEN